MGARLQRLLKVFDWLHIEKEYGHTVQDDRLQKAKNPTRVTWWGFLL